MLKTIQENTRTVIFTKIKEIAKAAGVTELQARGYVCGSCPIDPHIRADLIRVATVILAGFDAKKIRAAFPIRRVEL